jgi:hypothetical protein
MSGPSPRNTPSRSGQAKRRFQPAIGRDFGAVGEVEARSRGYLMRVVVSLTTAAIVATGGYGLTTGDHTPLVAVWAIAGPFVGAMVAYYFGPQRSDTG